jgi:undecaprenyl phosphate N,N'-diacetylbacillosamine 1-phosphate transferase
MRSSRRFYDDWGILEMSRVLIGKRLIDFVLSTLIIVLTLPVLLIASIGIKLSSPGPILFRQERIGRGGKPFEVLKLRTMTVNSDRPFAQTRNEDPDVFHFGGLLRRSKIDELPQLVNVLRGEMSLVGPRPVVRQVYADMPAWARKRLLVLPGITGLAQVSGNVTLSWEERWRLDVKYIETQSVLVDSAILLKTVGVVFAGEECFSRRL